MNLKNLLLYLLVLLGLVFIYKNSLNYDFTHWDDYDQVVENQNIFDLSFSKTAEIFSSTSVGMYQPITTFFYAIIYKISGPDAFNFHLASLVFHWLNCILLIQLLSFYKLDFIATAIAVTLFAFHPMQVESVAWVSAFSTLTFTFFSLISILFFIYKKENNSKYWLSFLFFLLACLSKSAAVFLPVFLLFLCNTNPFDIKKNEVIQMIPFFIISFAFGIITILSRESAGHLSDISQSFHLFERFFLVSHSYLFYFIKFILPINLSAFYAFPDSESTLPILYYLSPIVVVFLIYVIWRLREKKEIIIGFALYTLSLLLVLQIIPVGSQIATDRYIYFPMIGILIILIPLLKSINKKLSYILLIVPVLLAFKSQDRTKVWESDKTLWTDVIQKNEDVPQAYNNLASFELEENNLKKALLYVNKAINLKPNYADAFANRGNIYSQTGQNDLAFKDFEKAIKLKPHADAYFNRGNLYMQTAQFNNALNDYSQSIKLKASPDAFTNRAFCYLQLNNESKALQDLNFTIHQYPNFSSAYYLRGMLFIKKKRKTEACQNLSKASELGNNQAKAALSKFCQNN
jgi:tetratricopeptide (TPR) repeat protein